MSSVTQPQLNQISKFIGYGPPKPEIVFLGIEESYCGNHQANINTRAQYFEEREDLFAATRHLALHAGSQNHYYMPGNPVQQWNAMSKFALALGGYAYTDPAWQAFWRTRLGRKDYETFLMECFPVPKKNGDSILRDGTEYDPHTDTQSGRTDILKKFISEAKPRFLVGYGQDSVWGALADLVTVPRWKDVQGGWTIGEADNGIVVARVGFFGQGRFKHEDIPSIAREMIALAGHRAQITPP